MAKTRPNPIMHTLDEYDIRDGKGFLPHVDVPTHHNVPLANIALYRFVQHIPDAVRHHHEAAIVRRDIEALPTMDVSTPQLDLYHLSILSYISQLHMNGTHPGHDAICTHLPENIAIPLKTVADRLGIPAGMTYLTFVGTHPATHASFTGCTEGPNSTYRSGEQHFKSIHLAIEALGATAVEAMHWLGQHYQTMDAEQAAEKLATIKTSIEAMIKPMLAMKHNFTVDDFHHFRGFLSGSDRLELPFGQQFEGIQQPDGSPFYVRIAGGSGAQTPLIAALDGFFGVQHTHNKHMKPLLEQAKLTYLPGHQAFVEDVREVAPHIQGKIEKLGLNKEYVSCLSALTAFRVAHTSIVERFIGQSHGTGGSHGATAVGLMARQTLERKENVATAHRG